MFLFSVRIILSLTVYEACAVHMHFSHIHNVYLYTVASYNYIHMFVCRPYVFYLFNKLQFRWSYLAQTVSKII